MAELLQKERLQPSLLDRLTDNEPDKERESREVRVLSEKKLKQSVLRDLSWLLNSRALTSVQSLEMHPEVQSSVVNFGIRDLSGKAVSGGDAAAIERNIKQAIINFEPRIVPSTLNVRVVVDSGKMNLGAVTFDIDGELWAQPLPIHLYIRTDLDMETGAANVREVGG